MTPSTPSREPGAAPKPGTKACPHCGGLNGYCTIQRRTVTRLYGWSGQSEDCDDTIITGESAPRCADCNKPLTRAAISKATGGTQ